MDSAGFIDVQNGRLRYVVEGGGPPLVVVPGGPGFGYHYLQRPLVELLSEDRRLVFYDRDASEAPTGAESGLALTIEALVSDLEAVRSAIDAETVDVLGHSFGGLLALLYALEHPGRVRSLVSVDGDPARWNDWRHFRKVIDARRSEDDERRLQEIQSRGDWSSQPVLVEEYFRIYLRPYFGARDVSANLRFGFDSSSFAKLSTSSSAVRNDLGEWNLLDRLPVIDQPTLLLYGGQSIFRPGSAEAMHAALPASQLEIMPGVGHFPFLEDPEVFGSIVRRFLSEPTRVGTVRGTDPS